MHLEASAQQERVEYRRYFPDWTDRPLPAGEELEIDHNSYFAGGYAEEFGYLARALSGRDATPVEGVSQDDDELPLVRWDVLHPGYPLRPYPVSVDRRRSERREAEQRSAGGASHVGKVEVTGRGEFFRVTERSSGDRPRPPAHGLAAALMHLPAAIGALRRELPARRKGSDDR